MKSIVLVCILGLVALAAGHYTNKYDKVNMDEILNNPRLLSSYVKCILDQGKCSADGKEVKLHLKEGLQNGCADCTDIQKANSKRVMKHFINVEPQVWQQFLDKYDPQRVYGPKYEMELQDPPAK